MKRPCCIATGALLITFFSISPVFAQDARIGVALPLTISGDVFETSRARYNDPSAARVFAGFRLLAAPQIKLGPHWFGYTDLQLRSTPYFYQDVYETYHPFKLDVLQGFLGYSRVWNRTALAVKAGKLASAFGAFPLRYDDMTNPLLDQPLTYNYLLFQPAAYYAVNYGRSPVTLYGLPAAEVEFSWRRTDSRFQFPTSNPYNPQDFFKGGQHAQWTAGGGYTILQGFRVGMSAFRGPWLSGAAAARIPVGSSVRDFPASAVGVDIQWARGRWSAGGEWDRFVISLPSLSNAPTLNFGYAELKMIINPRWYTAFRDNFQTDNHAIVGGIVSPLTVYPNRQYYELAVGFRPNRFQLLKLGYEWAHVQNGLPNRNNVLGLQLVTAFNGLSKALK